MTRRRLLLAVSLLAALLGVILLWRSRRDAVQGTAASSKGTAGRLPDVFFGGLRAPAASPGDGGAGISPAPGRLVTRGAWGSAPGEFGHREANESNPEGPMALAAGKQGFVLLDQANARVTRFNPDGSIALSLIHI